MVRIDLAKVVGPITEEKKALPWIQERWHAQNIRPSSTTIWSFAAIVLILQSLVIWSFFFDHGPSVAAGPPYNTTETIELVTAWYELLVDMKYLGEGAIAYPPHVGENAINLTIAEELGLDSRVVDTIQKLPYIKQESDMVKPGWMGKYRDILWQNGHFVDYRNDTNLWRSRDPLLRHPITFEETGLTYRVALMLETIPFLPKTAIPLSIIRARKYGMALVLDTASNRIVVLDTQGAGNRDAYFQRWSKENVPAFYNIPKTIFYGETTHARLASDLLQDFVSKTARMESGYVPGSVREDRHYSPELSPPQWEGWVKQLYQDHGWPSHELEDCEYPSSRRQGKICDYHGVLEKFRSESAQFEKEIMELRHSVTVKYMPDWYCPVPRRPDVVEKLQGLGRLSDEQLAYAKSDEAVIPLDLDGWGMMLAFMQYEYMFE